MPEQPREGRADGGGSKRPSDMALSRQKRAAALKPHYSLLSCSTSCAADPARSEPLAALPDPRYDACLFLLAPGCLLGGALDALRLLATAIPVIPLIAKVSNLFKGGAWEACNRLHA